MKLQMFAFVAVLTVAVTPVNATAGAEPQKVDAPGIVNFSRITANRGFAGPLVGFGGATDPKAMPWLRSNGFATVINLRFASEPGADVQASRAAAKAAGLNYLHLPFDPKNSPPEVVDEFLAAVGDAANQPVYIHCGSATRVAALWMIGRVVKDGWEISAASEEARKIARRPADSIAFATRYLEGHGESSGDSP